MPVPAELMNSQRILDAFSNVQMNAMEAECGGLDEETNRKFDHAPMNTTPCNDDTIRLKRAPAWLCIVDKKPLNELYSRSHSFVMVSHNPGAGTHTGATYFSISGDENRSQVAFTDNFMQAVRAAKTKAGEPAFSQEAVATLEQLKSAKSSYGSKEAFIVDYVKARTAAEASVDTKTALNEAKLMAFNVPKDGLEMWDRPPLGACRTSSILPSGTFAPSKTSRGRTSSPTRTSSPFPRRRSFPGTRWTSTMSRCAGCSTWTRCGSWRRSCIMPPSQSR